MSTSRRKALLQGILLFSIRDIFGLDEVITPNMFPGTAPIKEVVMATVDSILFDLTVDPNEGVLIDVDPINSNYSDIYSQLLTRSEYWSNYVKTAETPDTAINKKTFWKKAGGITSWVTDVNFTAPTIPLKYTSSDQPHIIFVLVDDWGWNDVGFRSTYMSWTTPNIDRLAAEGVQLSNYFTSYLCTPTRGALLTGRYPIRLGLAEAGGSAELPLNETTLAQEMKSAGYRTYMVGKWHLGYSTIDHTPAKRGFDSSYTYWNGFVDYWTKESSGYLDLHDNSTLVTNEEESSSQLHNGYLMATKAELAISNHVANYPSEPMFLYYAMQLIHGEWSAPDTFLQRCGLPYISDVADYDSYVANVTYQYCALNSMLDEAVGNLTCALEKYGMADNTILVLVSDNGGEETVPGNSYPFIGNKGSYYRGGLSATGLVHSKLLPEAARGGIYSGQMHVTDWLPTLMGLATNNQWTGSLFGAELDGVDQWDAITTLSDSTPRSEIVHYHNGSSVSCIQIDMVKLNLGDLLKGASVPEYLYLTDHDSSLAACSCDNPSLMDYETTLKTATILEEAAATNPVLFEAIQNNVMAIKTSALLLVLAVAYFIFKSIQYSRKTPTYESPISNKNSVGANYGAACTDYSQIDERSSFISSDYRAQI